MPVMASESTNGAKKRTRRSVRPGKRRLSRSASQSANGIWTVRDRKTMRMLCQTAFRKTESLSAFV